MLVIFASAGNDSPAIHNMEIMMTTATNNKPAFKASIGAVTVTVWRNEGERATYYTTDITRTYKDAKGEWATTSSFNHDDLLNVAKLAERAESFIAKQKQPNSEA
jgi:hypothetical protein